MVAIPEAPTDSPLKQVGFEPSDSQAEPDRVLPEHMP